MSTKPPSHAPQPHAAAEVLGPGVVTALQQVPRERTYFRALLVGNPNYFGQLNPQGPVVAIQGNTSYEEVTCVGFSPQVDRLDAVVRLKQGFGYGGGVCTPGSTEYVRFYVSHDGGASWADVGVTSFTAHDVAASVTGTRRLQFGVSVPYAAARALCVVPNTFRVRAILSWNYEPPPNAPSWPPVWGNVLDATVAVDPRRRPLWADVLKYAQVKLTPELAQTIDLQQPAAEAASVAMPVAALHELYRAADVEPHRYAFAAITAATAHPVAAVAGLPPLGNWQNAVDVSQIVDAILATQGNTTYEELRCVGLRSVGADDALVAAFRIKRPVGFSGGPCTSGSHEYVTFWADVNDNGNYETYLGTAAVRVYDRPVPPEGLDYSVALPVNLNALRRLCAAGPRVLPIRAVLSWNTPASAADPNALPTWGNRKDTLVLIPPGDTISPDDVRPILYTVGAQSVCDIDNGTGRTVDGRPFGGQLCITGSIPSAMDHGPGYLQYKVTATRYAADGVTVLEQYTLSDPFAIEVTGATGSAIPTSTWVTQTATADGWFNYLEFGTPALGQWQQVSAPYGHLLAYWNTPNPTPAGQRWTIHVKSRRTALPAVEFDARFKQCGAIFKADAVITLDQTAPVVSVALDGPPCQDITEGATISGTFSVDDDTAVGSVTLTFEPGNVPITPVVTSSSTTHVSGTWTLDTAGLDPCGYVVRIDAWDRTVLGCGAGGWHNDDAAGFCLRRG